MKKNKICILTSVHSIFDTRIWHKQAKTLVKAGYNISLIAQHSKNEIVEGVKIITLPKPKNRLERFFKLNYLTYQKALQQRANIYHFHDPELLPWMIKLKKKTGAKVIYDVHEDVSRQISSKYWLPKILRKIISKIFNKYEKRIAKKLDYIITATPSIRDNFKQKNVIDIKNYPIIAEFLSVDLSTYNKRPQSLAYAGVIAETRGITKILHALTLLNDPSEIKFELAGNFSPNNFLNTLKKFPRWNLVNYHGKISRKELANLFDNVRVGMVVHQPIPNEINALPIKMFEYMAAGLPVVASNFFLLKNIIEKTNCGICINPTKPKKIAKAIEYLIKHPEEAKKMGENGRKAVLEKYNWENESKKLLEVYKNLS